MSQGFTYAVDLVLVIDATGSMSSIIERVKASALKFHDDLGRKMTDQNKVIDELRVRVVAYRDFYANDADALVQSEFFELPAEQDAFASFVSGIRAVGGGDEPETALEALVAAVRSPWTTSGTKRRHAIVVWTDASAHPLEKNGDAKPARYPADMPADLSDLTDLWEGQDGMDANAKRLVLFAPDAYPWTDINNHWEEVLQYPAKAGQGMEEMEYSEVLELIANSIG
ncbi:MAG TPA: vWA domain-containing protein [Actinocrinis sp.]|nr:vWA domain-containing protein [Actinocrinis sp.]